MVGAVSVLGSSRDDDRCRVKVHAFFPSLESSLHRSDSLHHLDGLGRHVGDFGWTRGGQRRCARKRRVAGEVGSSSWSRICWRAQNRDIVHVLRAPSEALLGDGSEAVRCVVEEVRSSTRESGARQTADQ